MATSRFKMLRELIGGVLQRGNFMKGRHPSATPWQKKIAQLSEKCQPFHHLRLSELVRS
jgi:hypothetical protein